MHSMYRISSIINMAKNLDSSYKMDLDSLELFRKGTTGIMAKIYWADLVICSHSGESKTPSYS